MKAQVGVDSETKLIHTAVATAANIADSAVLPDLWHGEETRVWGDQAYRGQTEVIRECAPQAQDCIHRRFATRIASMKWSERRIGRSRPCAQRWNMGLE